MLFIDFYYQDQNFQVFNYDVLLNQYFKVLKNYSLIIFY